MLKTLGSSVIPTRFASSAQASLRNILGTQLDEIRQAGTWKDERVITTMQAAMIGVSGQSEKMLNFCANNYLGLSVSNCSLCTWLVRNMLENAKVP